MMSGAKAPDFDACGLLRQEQAHGDLDLLILASYNSDWSAG